MTSETAMIRIDKNAEGYPASETSICVGGPWHGVIVSRPMRDAGYMYKVPHTRPEEWETAFYDGGNSAMNMTVHAAMYRPEHLDISVGPLRLSGRVFVWEHCTNWKRSAMGLVLGAAMMIEDAPQPRSGR